MSAVVLTTASFDMTNIKQNETKVAVFDEVVEVHLYGEIEDTKELVGSGYVAAVSEKDSEIQMIAFSESKEGDDQVWANLNTLKDLEYIDDVEKELEEKVAIEAGVLPGDSLYGAKKLNESAKLTVAGNETNNAKIKVDIAEKRLNEAGALLASGETEVAGEILDEFEQIIIEIDKVAQDIPEVNNYVNEMMGEALKDVAVLDNDSDLFPLKEVVEGAQIDILKSELQAGLEPSKIVQWGILKGNEHAVLHGAATEDASEQILPEEQE